jgi:hypothetical protein
MRGFIMIRAGLIVAMLLLAACGGARWTKSGISPGAASADLDDCESQARAATRRDTQIDADIMASRGTDWQRTGTLGIKRDDMAMSTGAHFEDVVGRCMSAKGYRPVS